MISVYFQIDKLAFDFFSSCNFSNRLNFESITEDDINQVEQFVREKGLDFAQKKLQTKIESHDEILFYGEQLVDYFGEAYASNPSNFRFEIGDRKLIRIVRDHLIKQQNEKGARFKRRFRKKPERENPKFKHATNTDQLSHQRTVAPDMGNNFVMNAEEMDDGDETICRNLSVGLFQRVKNYMQTFDIDDSIIQRIKPNIVSVKIVEDLVVAEVFCAVCQNDDTKRGKMKGKRVYYKGGEGSRFWVLSNFGQHLKNVHKLTSRSIEELALAHNFSVEYESVDTHTHTTIGSNDMYNQITTQIRTIVEATLSNNDATEQMFYELIANAPQPLKIATIVGNGDCLFSSMAHQLFSPKINSTEHINATKNLRKCVVEYISQHYESFKFELQGRVYEEINAESITDLDKERRDILEKYLPLDGYWGGTESLKAIQQMHHVNILIFREHGLCYFFNNFNEEYTRTLILAFRISNPNSNNYDHYDSVCDISSNEILNSIKYLLNASQKQDMIFDDTL